MRKTLMEIYDDNWKNENVSFIEALVDVIKEIESRLSALERQPSSLPSPTKVGEVMTDFDALIDNFEKSRDAMYETVTAQEREEIKERHKQSRSTLREAIASLQWSYDECMLQYDHQQERACDAEARVAALEAEYEEAMQFILAVNQPHDYDCAHYVYDKNPCDCGYQKLVDTYLSKRGRGLKQ